MSEHPAVTFLRHNQRQLDADGCEVGVSRQALDEALATVEQLRAERDTAVGAWERVNEDPVGAAERDVGRWVYQRISKLMDAKENTPEALELTWLAACVESVEEYGAIHCEGEELAAFPVPGEEFLEFKEALSDLRSLRQENRDLNGGGPGWGARWAAAWAKADELFADEDEAAYDRHIESFYG